MWGLMMTQNSSVYSQKNISEIRQKLGRLVSFYADGFHSMRTGKTLWKIIILKLIALLVILKLFFPNYLQTNFSTDQQRADHVLENITNIKEVD